MPVGLKVDADVKGLGLMVQVLHTWGRGTFIPMMGEKEWGHRLGVGVLGQSSLAECTPTWVIELHTLQVFHPWD